MRKPGTAGRSEYLLEMLGNEPARNFSAVHTGRYVYAEYQNGDREFYDMQVDPYQLTNMVNDPNYQGIIAELMVRLANLK
jgi:hypothetical protein